MSHSRNPGTGTVTDTYIYPATSNRLSSITLGAGGSRGLTYDAAGNVTGDNRAGQNYTYVYDAAGRMAAVSLGGVLQAEYKYDYLGRQYSRKLVPSNTTIHSVFRSDGKRISEYNEGTGALIRHYVWMGDTPVAVIEGGQIYYVRTDWIGRPVFATTLAGTVVWTASYLPFGGVRVTTGAPIDLRFPGQWFQAEAGLHQNWMRDYDPTTGRYMQADPLGLVDGASLYGYAGQSPLMNSDPTGQCFGPAIAALPYCIGLAWMLYEYLADECYTWMDFAYSFASNMLIPKPLRPLMNAVGGGGSGGAGGGGGGPDGGGPPASTPVGSRGNEIQVPAGSGNKSANSPTTIGERDYSGHALDRMQERGYVPSVAENAIRNGTASPGNSPGTTKYYDSINNVSVVVDSGTGRVVTVRGGP